MFPINVSLFVHLGKHCCGSKNFPKKFRNIFVAETMFPSLSTCFQMFPAQETLFSRLGKFKDYSANINNTLIKIHAS